VVHESSLALRHERSCPGGRGGAAAVVKLREALHSAQHARVVGALAAAPSACCARCVSEKENDFVQVAFADDGRLVALDLEMFNNGGCSLDLSSSIMDRALLHCDNVYRVPHLRAVGHVCRTNVASNTAFRGFGGPQVGLLGFRVLGF
jgi:xanthine dehydrogenase molybdopterin-binding subunit B